MKHLLKTMAIGAALGAGLAAIPAQAEEDALVSFQVLTPELANELAMETMLACRKMGYQAGVTVVDRFGVPQAYVRDRFAGAHVYETSRRKAWTTVSFRITTEELAESTQSGRPESGIRHIGQVMALGGGVPIEAAGTIVGGVGVSGAPGGKADEDCARQGLAAIEEKLPL